MKKLLSLMLVLTMLLTVLTACGSKNETKNETNDETTERKSISMWFWGTSDYQRTAMEKYLVEGFNNSQDEYTLTVEYRSSVDSDVAVALSGGGGPDIVYGSGPSFVAGYAAEGLLVNLDSYAEKYGWKDRMVDSFYDLCSVDGSLYSITGGMTNYGVFYNAKVLEENGWSVPTTYEELTTIMDEAIAKGLYGGLIGAKDWRYTNEWLFSILMTSVAGYDSIYNCLTGEEKWNNPDMVEAVNEMKVWYDNGYVGGDDYWNLDANEMFQLLMEGKAPFCFAPFNGFQWAKNVAPSEEDLDNIGFIAMPNKDGSTPVVSLGGVCSFSVNSKSENPDGAAAVLDWMLTADFAANMSSEWPGYWGMPVKDFVSVDPENYEGFSRAYIEACIEAVDGLNSGSFSFVPGSCFPAQTFEASIDIDTVWFGDQSAEQFLDAMDVAYAKDVEAGTVLAVPKPNF